MSYCLNPSCPKPQNAQTNLFCQNCGTKLLLGDRYRALKLIGQGGFGRTLLAQDEYKPSKPYCVIKQFYPQGQGNTGKAAELFQQEANRLEQLGKHPQIPELYAHFEQEQRQYIVQEFIDGQNLLDILARTQHLTEAEIIELLLDLLPVLEFIHQGNVIHRDIKPENIIRRNADGKLVLVDFGAAKYASLTALGKTGTTIGSAGYAAPEQNFGKAIFASDLYSLGVTCIHLLTNVDPFQLYDVIENNFVWRDYLIDNPVSNHLGSILDKMIAGLVKDRYQSASAILNDLGQKNIGSQQVYWLTTLAKPEHLLWCLAVSGDGNYVAYPNLNHKIELLNWKTGEELGILGGWLTKHSQRINTLAFSPDGAILASGSSDRTIKLWDVASQRLVRILKGHSGGITALAFSPDGQTLVSGSSDHRIKVWDLRTLKLLHTFSGWFVGHSSGIRTLSFNPQGNLLASGGRDGKIKVWDLRRMQLMSTFTPNTSIITSLAFSPDGKTLVSATGDVQIWNLEMKQLTKIIGDGNGAIAITFNDANTITIIDQSGLIKIWDLSQQKRKFELQSGIAKLIAVTISNNGQIIATSSQDRNLKIWQINL